MAESQGIRRSPYQGLVPYSEDDAPFFFGREKETRLIAANLFASPLTLLYGASGVGKSSVLRAGAAHQLKQRDDLLVVVFNTWQGDPLGELQVAVARAAAQLKENGFNPSPSSSLAEFLAGCSAQLNRRVMVILDQFEEYFLYHPQEDDFSEQLPRAVMLADAPVSFLISLREDALAKLDRFEGRISTLFDNYLRIEHLSLDAARAAILKPIEKYNDLFKDERPATIEPELVEAILEQVRTGEVTLGESGQGVVKSEVAESQIETPYLQMVMTRIWDEEARRGSRRLRLETLNGLGGAKSIVRTHLDVAMSGLSVEKQDVAARVFRYLVTPSGSKIAHTIPDLAALAEVSPQRLALLMKDLLNGRILRDIAPPMTQPNEPRYEIFHDVLAAAILDWRARYLQAQQQAETVRILSASLDRALAELNEIERDIMARIFPLLITPRHMRVGIKLEELASRLALPQEQITKVVSQPGLRNIIIIRKDRERAKLLVVITRDILVEPIESWLRKHPGGQINYVSSFVIKLAYAAALLLIVFAVYSLFSFWPRLNQTTQNYEQVSFLFWKMTVSGEARLLIVTVIAGLLGGVVSALQSFYRYTLEHVLSWKSLGYHALLPVNGAFLAFTAYLLLRGGFLLSVRSEAINLYGLTASAALLGMFSKVYLNKLIEMFGVLFKLQTEKDISANDAQTKLPNRERPD